MNRRSFLAQGAAAATVLSAPLAEPLQRALAASSPPKPRVVVGVNQHLTQQGLGAGKLRKQVALAKWLGAEASRSGLHWSQVEQTQGTYDWSIPDRAVAALRKEGIQMLWTLSGRGPDWLQPGVPSSADDPTTWKEWVAGYVRFAKAAAKRYAHVPYWELWNEPNLRHYWDSGNTGRSSPHDYRLWYQAVRDALHDTLPSSAKIAVGGLTNATRANPHQPSGMGFLHSMLVRPRITFDRLAVHTYSSDDHSPDIVRPGANFQDVNLYRKSLVANHLSNVKLWITEWGWPTGPGGVSDATQAKYIIHSLDRIRDDWSGFIEVSTVFIDYDRPGLRFGLFGPPPHYDPKPSATQFRAWLADYKRGKKYTSD